MFRCLLLLAILCCLPTDFVYAEVSPEITDFVPKCPLIVHARIDPQPKPADQTWVYADVVEVLAGDYHPEIFAAKPPRNQVAIDQTDPPAQGMPSRHVIVFYGHNSSDGDGMLTRPDMVLRIENDLVVHPLQSELPESKTYRLDEFKRMIKAIASDVAVDKSPARILAAKRTASFPNRPLSWDLSGQWRMFLPAGFEQPITLTKIGEGRYEMAPRHLSGSGIYEIEGTDLVFAQGDDKIEPGAYRWTLTSKHLVTLTKQTHNAGSDYVGAILFRPKEKK